jgi:transcriptional regulator with XRE-family HTH domain
LKQQRIDDNTFGRRLKDIRKSLKLTQEIFAQKMNISITNLSDIENGKTKPGHDFFYRILTDFKVNLNYLVSGEGPIFLDSETDKAGTGKDQGNRYYIDVDSEDVRLFLDYFSRSKVLKYMLLASFHRIMNDEEDSIRKEIDRLRMNSEIKTQEDPEIKT